MALIQVLLLLGVLAFASGDEGVGIDPFGRPTATATTDEGNGLDPHGGRVTTTADDGNGFDPHG